MALDTAAAYAETRGRLVELVRDCSEEELGRAVPACPLWSVADVIRHLTGVAEDYVAGDMRFDLNPVETWHTATGAASGDAFTAGHITRRAGVTLEQVITDWGTATERLLPVLRGEAPAPQAFPFIELAPVSDLAVHAQDVRGALARPGDRESAGVGIALASYAGGLGLRLSARGMPALRIRYGDRERVVGGDVPAATWTGDRYEVFRALAGRRSRRQIQAMGWEGDPSLYLPLIPAYGERTDDLIE